MPGWPAWTLTLDNFRDYCEATGYHLTTGRKAESITLDRKDNRFGYHVWNLDQLTKRQNSQKGAKVGAWVLDEASGEFKYHENEVLPF